jgi:hypothetical protein
MEPPLRERPLLGGKGYQRDGAVSRLSLNEFFLFNRISTFFLFKFQTLMIWIENYFYYIVTTSQLFLQAF